MPTLEIDHEATLSGTTPSYAEQLLVSTGTSDWPSRIEDEPDDTAIPRIKRFLGRNGQYADPYHNVMITTSSLRPTPAPSSRESTTPTTSAYLFPSFKYVPRVPLDDDGLSRFIKGFVLPEAPHESYQHQERVRLSRDADMQRHFPDARDINEIMILICGHGRRDERCGVMGPLLAAEFEDKLGRQNIKVLSDSGGATETLHSCKDGHDAAKLTARVALVSHVGGHKFAGNVILYIPPTLSCNSLAGNGIWYGRVQPGHVEGIVSETILGGRVIKDLFRGGLDRNANALRL